MKSISKTDTSLADLAREFEKYRNGRHRKGVKYPPDLRQKLLLTIDQGKAADEVLKVAGIEGSTLARWRRLEGGQKLSKRRVAIVMAEAKPDFHKEKSKEHLADGGKAPPAMPKISLPSGIVIELPLEMLGQAIAALNGSHSC